LKRKGREQKKTPAGKRGEKGKGKAAQQRFSFSLINPTKERHFGGGEKKKRGGETSGEKEREKNTYP